MPVETCTVPDCGHVTNDYPATQAVASLHLHMRGAHPELFLLPPPAVVPVVPPPRSEKVNRPTLKMSGPFVNEETFGYFEQRWIDYKTLTGVTIANLHLRNCLPDKVGKIIYSRYGDTVKTQTEAVLLDNVKRMVVKAKNVLTSVVELRQLQQEPEQTVESFLAKMKVTGRRCNLKVHCTCGADTDY